MAHAVGRKTGVRRSVRVVAGVAAVSLGATAIVAAGGGTAGAATVNAQSVGRFLDGSAGGNPIQDLVDLKDARATAPGTTSAQNPLDVKAFNALDIPLSNAINIPTSPAVDAGVVNQVATANTNGRSLGAAGAVADDGGASLGDDNDGEPDAAKIDLTDAAFGSVDIPGLGTAPALPNGAALGGVTGAIHSVFSRAATAKGGEAQTPSSGIAGLTLTIGSPALANLLTQLKGAFGTSNPLAGVLAGLDPRLVLGNNCALTAPDATDVKLAGGAVTISPTGASITVDVGALIKTLLDGTDISNLDTSNFDLVSFLVENLPDILANGVGTIVTSTTTALATELTRCFPALSAVINPLLQGQGQIKQLIDSLAAPFSSAGGAGLSQLADGLKNLVDIGLNVQSGPGIEPREKTYDYDSNLDATPNQATEVVDGQTLVRAIEINILDVSAIPGTGGSGVLNVALANSAAGPSEPAAAVATSTPAGSPTVVDSTNIPTGIPAGQATGIDDNGSPVLPMVAVLLLLMVSGAAFWQLRSQRGPGGLHR